MTTQRKIYITLMMLIGASLVVIAMFALLAVRQERIFAGYARNQVVEAARVISEMEEIHLYWVAYEFSTWDDMVDYVHNPDTILEREYLDEALFWYELQGFWVLNLQGDLVYENVEGCATPLYETLRDRSLLEKLHAERELEFYMISRGEMVLISGATIHLTDDEDKETDPHGFVFVARCWNDELMDMLERLTGSRVEVIDPAVDPHMVIQDNAPGLSVLYNDLDGETAAILAFTKEIDFSQLLRRNNRLMLILLLATLMLGFLGLILSLRRWVSKPLALTASIISENNTAHIDELKKSSLDFANIGNLVESFILQKQELVVARDKAEQSDRLKSAFLANLSHEIRTPLTGVVGFAELLKDDTLTSEERARYIDVILGSSKHLLKLIDDLLDLSSLESGFMHLRNKAFLLETLMLELQSFYVDNKILVGKNLTLLLEYGMPEGQDEMFTDRVRLQQVLINLLDNAIKFTRQGSITFGCKPTENKHILFFVKDTGPGIPDAVKNQVFERFNQGSAENAGDRHHGAGLGLSIAKGIVEIMEGSIWFESTAAGTTFFVSIPQKNSEYFVSE